MSRTITVITPENMTITYQAAGIASRFMAVIVDLLIQLASILLVRLGVQSLVGGGHSSVGPSSLVSTVGIIIVGIVIPFVYSIFFEIVWSGRTPGKRLFGLRTVRDGGYPINFFSSVVRNILRIIDFGLLPLSTPLVLCGLPGLACMFLSPTYKRIGDYAAGTLVVVDNNAPVNTGLSVSAGPKRKGKLKADAHIQASIEAEAVAAFVPLVRNIERLTREEYELIRRFTTRRRQFDPLIRAGLAERLARPLLAKLDMNIAIHYQLQYLDILQAIERRFAEERGLL